MFLSLWPFITFFYFNKYLFSFYYIERAVLEGVGAKVNMAPGLHDLLVEEREW